MRLGIEKLKAVIATLGNSTPHANPLKESPSSCPNTCFVNGGPRGIVQTFLGTEMCGSFCRQGSRTENSVRGGSDRGRNEVLEALGKGPFDTPPVVSPQLTELHDQINVLVLERDAPLIRGIPKEAQGTWMGDFPRVEDIPPMPTSDKLDEPT